MGPSSPASSQECLAQARLVQVEVIGRKRRAERDAGIACHRLDPDRFQLAIAHHLAVCDAIERDPTSEAQLEASKKPKDLQTRLFRVGLIPNAAGRARQGGVNRGGV